MFERKDLSYFSAAILVILVGLFARATPAAEAIVLDTTGQVAAFTTRPAGSAPMMEVGVGTTTTITAFTVLMDPASNGNIRYFIADANTHTVLYDSGSLALTDVGVANYRSPAISPGFTLTAGQSYFIGAIMDVGANYYYGTTSTNQNGLTAPVANGNYTNFAAPTYNSTAGAAMGAQLITGTTAADVSVTGRVVNSTGSAVRGAVVTFSGSDGHRYSARTNAFGYYSLSGLPAGETFIANVSYRGLVFVPRAITVRDALAGVDFAAR